MSGIDAPSAYSAQSLCILSFCFTKQQLPLLLFFQYEAMLAGSLNHIVCFLMCDPVCLTGIALKQYSILNCFCLLFCFLYFAWKATMCLCDLKDDLALYWGLITQ